jgi:hypothetical protein
MDLILGMFALPLTRTRDKGQRRGRRSSVRKPRHWDAPKPRGTKGPTILSASLHDIEAGRGSEFFEEFGQR